MSWTATAELRELFGSLIEDFLVGHLLDEFPETVQSESALGLRGLVARQVFGEERRRQIQRLTALEKAVAKWRVHHQLGKLLCHRMTGSHKLHGGPVTGHDRLERVPLRQREESTEQFRAKLEAMKL